MVAALREAYARERERIAGLAGGGGDYANPVFGEGPEAPLALLIGEAPGAEEARQGRPFVGRAGRQLDELLALAGLDRGALYVTNAVKFRPIKSNSPRQANRTPTLAEVKAGLPLLRLELEQLAPKVIVTLGNTPLKAVCRIAGRPDMTVGAAHGRPVELTSGQAAPVLFPQYHPASVIYDRSLQDTLRRDLQALGEYLNGMKN